LIVCAPMRRAALLLSLFATLSLSAALAPPKPVKGDAATLASARMLDARVNLKSSYVHATQHRAAKTRSGAEAAQLQSASIVSAVTTLRATVPGLDVKMSGYTGAPEAFRNARGALTAASGASRESIVRGFLNSRGSIFGLSSADVNDFVLLGDSAGGKSGLRMVRMEQQIDGRPVFQSETRFILDKNGRLIEGLGRIVPHARTSGGSITAANFMTPAAALVKLLAFEKKTLDPATVTAAAVDATRAQLSTTDDTYIAGPVNARQILFPLAPGLLVPAWSLHVFTNGDADWYAIIDAETGDVLWRKNARAYASAHDARFRVYVQADGVTPADSPAPQSPNAVAPGAGTQFPGIAPTIVSMHTAMDPAASPNGWIDDCPGGVCTANESQTLGNNTLTCLDRVGGANSNLCDTAASSVLDGNGRPTGNPDANTRNRDFLGTAPRDFQTNYLPPPQGGNPEAGQTATGNGNNGTLAVDQFRRGVVTHLFYLTNWYHDKLFALGFDEASGNFQQTNFSGMGLGGDRVLGDAQDNTSVDNANFATFPDGTSGRMQMYRFTGATIDRDGSLDAEIVLHELTHGTSNRLVGDAAGLNWDPAAGMGEGWSDFFALSLLNNTNADTPTGQYASGAYATYKIGGFPYLDNYVYGIRRFPYSSNNSVNPITWADVDDTTNDLSGGITPDPLGFNFNGGMEVHNIGEVWMSTLWDVRSRVIADPAGANGDVPAGNHTMLQLVTDGLKMTPIDPNFVEARDAILNADCATNACANEDSIWAGFADRGFGYGAEAPYYQTFAFAFSSHMAFHESFALPALDVIDPLTDVAINDTATNNNGAIDSGEAVKLTVTLTNPWRRATKAVTGATATLTSSTTGVTIWDNTSTYGAIAPQGTAAGDTFTIALDTTVPNGSTLSFSLSITSNLGVTTTDFTLRVGKRNGTDPAVTYTSTPALVITDGEQLGVTDSMAVTDDFEIADVDFRLDSLTHTYDGDINVMLRSPGGVGSDLISMTGLLLSPDNFGSAGVDYTNTLMDDDPPTVGDLFAAPDSEAPYTGSYLPIYNTPTMAAFGIGRPDPVGTLSRYDGTSTLGTWQAFAADHATPDEGTLNSWSLIVTPVHFDAAAFVPSATITATKTASGTFLVGSTVTYTVTLTNNGTDGQLDNTGNEFNDVLPAGLTLVNATATSGTAVPTVGTNTVTWNGSLAPLGGTVTITITATINAGTQGTSVSNQGSLSYDANNDNVNEASGQTDDPAVAGTTNPTVFLVGNAILSGTKTASGTFSAGSTVTYTVTLSNTGNSASPDNAGNEFSDVLPAQLTLVNASASSGAAVATVGTNTVTWNGSVPAGGSVTITITATVNAAPLGTTITNQGTINYDADLNGSNETTTTTDDPGAAGTNNPTSFLVSGATVSGTKTASGAFTAGSTVTYTVTLNNTGSAASTDNAGNEFSDVLPAQLTLVSANASSGAAVATVGTNTVTWNGSVPASGSVTITITATINAVAIGTTVSNQGTINYDADLNGSNETTTTTDDPAVGGTNDPTSFSVTGASVTGTKTASGSTSVGGTVTYTIVLSNSGSSATADNPGNEFSDVLPSGLTLVGANATTGAAVATVGTNTVTWNGSIPASGSVTITITATINASAAGTTVSNQGTFNYDADLNGTNESSGVTDDPAVAGSGNPTSIAVAGLAIDTLTKTVSGTFTTGSTVTYTLTITNTGDAASPDNAGNELTDVLPSQLTLTLAGTTASSGAAVVNLGTNTVTWDGSVPAGGSVTITITATIEPGNEGSTISNQATLLYDSDGNGSNETTVLSDDPGTPAANDPTAFAVAAAAVPTVSELGLLLLAAGLAMLAAWKISLRS
jgi:uncharacterized repeat protein (TIGR01451 family)